jgi:DNA replication and repair protein RecF
LLLLKDISLVQFRNYSQATFPFRERIIGICGSNGVGKTNLLDAIYYLCFTRSYFIRSDQQNVANGADGFRIAGRFEKQGSPAEVVCIFRGEGGKEFLFDGEPYEKFSAHIGRFPCVIIAPDDVQIITGGSEERRRFLDSLLSQLDPAYLLTLIEYNRVLQQRNGFLKSLEGRRPREEDRQLLEVYDGQLARPGTSLFDKRRAFLAAFLPQAGKFYAEIAGSQEPVQMSYRSQLLESAFQPLLQRTLEKDLHWQRTGSGIHKDDIELTFSGQPFKSIASQGQRKSLLFALKLAEYGALREAKGFAPVLLLDDVFEKLDEARMRNLLNQVCLRGDGQIFITDTHKGRIEAALDPLALPYQILPL